MPQLDAMTDEQAIFALEGEFSGWLIYRGTERLCHARHHEDEIHVRGDDWLDLRDRIIREIGRTE